MFLQRVYDNKHYCTKDGVRMRAFYRVLCTQDSEIPSDWKPSDYASGEIDHAAPKFKDFVKRSFYMNEILYALPPKGVAPIKVNEADKFEEYEWVDENKFVHEMYSCIDHIWYDNELLDDEKLLLDDELL